MSANTYLLINIHDYSVKLMDWDMGLVSDLCVGTSLEDALLKADSYEENHYFDVEYGIHLDHEKPRFNIINKADKVKSILRELDLADVRVSLGNPTQRVITVKGRTMKLSTWLKKKLLSI